MRILLLNGNTNGGLTETLAAEARLYAGRGTEIIAVNCTRGARFVASRAAEVIAAQAMLEVASAHFGKYDAVLIAISFDTALHALRELLPTPVVGMTEASCHAACMVGSRFGVVVPSARTASVYRERIEGYGLGGRLAGMRVVDRSAAELYEDPDSALEAVGTAARALVQEDGCESVVLAGAALVGLHRRLQAQLPVPVLDGIACGVGMLEALARLGLPKAQCGSFAVPEPATLCNIDPALARLLNAPSGEAQ